MQSVISEYRGVKVKEISHRSRRIFIVTRPMRTISFISSLADDSDRPRMPDERDDPPRVD